MNLNDYIEENSVPIEEGIVFFKNSKKMKRLANTILQKTQLIEDENEKKKVITLVNKINRLAEKFGELEQMYKARKTIGKSSESIKAQYQEVETEYSNILALAKKEQMKAILKNLSIYGTMLAAMTIPSAIMVELAKKFGKEDPTTGLKQLTPLARAGSYIAMSGVIRAASPTDAIERGYNNDVVSKSFQAMDSKSI